MILPESERRRRRRWTFAAVTPAAFFGLSVAAVMAWDRWPQVCALGSVAVEALTPGVKIGVLLIEFGQPDFDRSSAHGILRPIVVTRTLTFVRPGVSATYRADVRIGEPVPDDAVWTLTDLTDPHMKTPIQRDEAQQRLLPRSKGYTNCRCRRVRWHGIGFPVLGVR
jgi:hypothetical protein